MIIGYFGDGSRVSPATGQPFGVRISYFVEEAPLGNAGALFQMKDRLTEDFLLLNAGAVLFCCQQFQGRKGDGQEPPQQAEGGVP